MALAATQEKSLQRCCAIASELLDVLSRIPAACMRAISAPFVSPPLSSCRIDTFSSVSNLLLRGVY